MNAIKKARVDKRKLHVPFLSTLIISDPANVHILGMAGAGKVDVLYLLALAMACSGGKGR